MPQSRAGRGSPAAPFLAAVQLSLSAGVALALAPEQAMWARVASVGSSSASSRSPAKGCDGTCRRVVEVRARADQPRAVSALQTSDLRANTVSEYGVRMGGTEQDGESFGGVVGEDPRLLDLAVELV